MRIVHVEDIFYPEAGYQVNILSKYEVMEGHEVYIITCPMDFWDEQRKEFWGADNIEERDRKYELESGAKVIRFPTVRKYSSRILYKKGLKKYIEQLNPDILFIHAESSFVTFQYLLTIRKNTIPIIMDSHSLEMAAKNKFRKLFYFLYRHTFAKIIEKNNLYIIRTQDDDFLMKRLGIPERLTPFISFGSDMVAFHPSSEMKKKVRSKLSIDSDAFVVVVSGKLTEDKGGRLLARAFEHKFKSNRELILITVGTPTNDPYGSEVTALLENSENRIIRIPTQKYYDLAPYYQASDLSVFARQCSLSFFDVQACGLPVVFEDNHVNIQRSEYQNALVFKHDDVEDLKDKICYFANLSLDKYRAYSENAIRYIEDNYDYKEICKQYTKLMNETIENHKIRQYKSI